MPCITNMDGEDKNRAPKWSYYGEGGDGLKQGSQVKLLLWGGGGSLKQESQVKSCIMVEKEDRLKEGSRVKSCITWGREGDWIKQDSE